MAKGNPLYTERAVGIVSPREVANEVSSRSTKFCVLGDVLRESRVVTKDSQGHKGDESLRRKDATSRIRRRAALAQADGAMMIFP